MAGQYNNGHGGLPREAVPAFPVDHFARTVEPNARTEQRRDMVENLQLMGYSSVRAIAQALKASEQTIRNDLVAIRQRRRIERMHTLEERLDLSVSMRQEVQRQAWRMVNTKGIGTKDMAALLQVILIAQDTIDRLEGTMAPEALNSAALAEVYGSLLGTLEDIAVELGISVDEAQQRYAARLQHRLHGTQAGVVLGLPGGSTWAADQQSAEMVDADEGGDGLDGTSSDGVE